MPLSRFTTFRPARSFRMLRDSTDAVFDHYRHAAGVVNKFLVRRVREAPKTTPPRALPNALVDNRRKTHLYQHLRS